MRIDQSGQQDLPLEIAHELVTLVLQPWLQIVQRADGQNRAVAHGDGRRLGAGRIHSYDFLCGVNRNG